MNTSRQQAAGRKRVNYPRGLLRIALLLVLCLQRNASADELIPLRPEMLLNETAMGDAAKLVDEQNAIGDPASGKGLRPQSAFFPGWQADRYPVSVVVDLGAVYRVTSLWVFNETGESPLVLSVGKPFQWKARNVTLNGYQQWKTFPLNAATRYLRITLTRPTSLPEIALYGARVEQAAPVPLPPPRPRTPPTMEQFIGMNGFIDDAPEQMAGAGGFVREYHNWSWDTESADKQVRFQPSGAAGGKAWFFDAYYSRLKALGVTVCPAIQQNSPAYFPGADSDAKPITNGVDSEAPASYAVHAAHLFQYAARYGSRKVPDSALKLAPGQPRLSGLNTLRYIENWNEPDKTWRGRAGRFTPYELAAMCSADYDGDQGRMGKTAGVRNADPKMRLVMGGLAGLSLDYLRGMKFWADWHRNGDFPADVLNLHHYSSDGDEQGFKTTGISPEADHLREKLAAIVAWRNSAAPKCEVWLTEFGYDTNPKSPLHAPAIGSQSAEETQANWLVRSYMALAAAGVDRAAMFMFRDVKSDDGGVFATCGLVTEKGAWKPKPAYFYLATLKKRLAGMSFAGEVPSNRKDALIYRFANAAGKSAYVVWAATSEDRRVPGVTFSLKGKSATKIEFTAGSMTGNAAPIEVEDGKVTLEAREQPVILLSL